VEGIGMGASYAKAVFKVHCSKKRGTSHESDWKLSWSFPIKTDRCRETENQKQANLNDKKPCLVASLNMDEDTVNTEDRS
jgi:hypothetical protein